MRFTELAAAFPANVIMIACENLSFAYPGESFSLEIASFSVDRGETVAVTGPSGCGKTTLLRLIAGILVPRGGSVRVGEQMVSALSRRERQAFRIEQIGIVQQEFELLDYLTVVENVLLPYRISARVRLTGEARLRADRLLGRLGIDGLGEKYPQQLSQGERQRTAICRGLVTAPGLILADEPTGNLDPENQSRSVALLLEQAAEMGATVVMVTHEPSLLPLFTRTVHLPDLRSATP